jgi:hypothetical protein
MGVCTHPEHARGGVSILIYDQETRCRRGFGDDDWAPACPAPSRAAQPGGRARPDADVVIDERPAPIRRRHAFPLLSPLPVYLDLEDAISD